MNAHLTRAATKLRRSRTLLEHRRLTWTVETQGRIYSQFQDFVNQLRRANFPIDLRLEHYEVPNAGCIQIHAQPMNTGLVKAPRIDPWHGDMTDAGPLLETGGDLVASLSPTGLVHFIAHPRQSPVTRDKREAWIILDPYDPRALTEDAIQKALRHYLLILQGSSLIGQEDALTFVERIHFTWIRFRELGYRYELYREVLSMRNNWLKVIFPLLWVAVGSLLTAVLSAWGGK